MLEQWRSGIIIKIQDETPTTKRFWIQIPELTTFQFIPGQFVTLDLPIHEQKNKRWRSYSIASHPDGSNIIELIIVKLEGGLGTSYLFQYATIGMELTLRGPIGKFTLPETISTNLFLVCTGTGIAPFRSMVNYIHANNIQHQSIYLIFGCRKKADSLYLSELNELTKKLENFYFIPTYSRETDVPEGSQIGYVHRVYTQLIEANPAYKTNASVYLCGWKQMVDEAKNNLQALGVSKNDIHLELYG